jgi:predicted O-linked N-acetylglucosamine transferase (SPINDLY family)
MLGELEWRMGRGTAALASMQRAAALSPGDVSVHQILARGLQALGRLAEAEVSYRRVLKIAPQNADAHNDMGNVLLLLDRLVEAEMSYRRAVHLRPDYVEAHSNLGNALRALGRLPQAEDSLRRALRIRPEYVEAHNNLGAVLRALGRFGEAEASLRQALQLKPALAEAHNNLGNVLRALGRLAEAEESYRRALQIRPQYVDAQANLAGVVLELGRAAEATAGYRQALRIRPQYPQAYDGLLLSLLYQAGVSAEELLRAHRDYDAGFGAPLRAQWADHRARRGADSSSDRRLKVGYVSPDLRQHSVAHFIAPVLRERDRRAVEIFCYAEVAREDDTSSALRELSDHWLNTVGTSDAVLAERIVADEIDILVDLAGHTAGNRLLVFARKPAPIQVSWLGYPHTTGLSAMDYRLVDAITDPPGEADRRASETLIRLEDGFLCFEPPTAAPRPCAPPCLASNYVTFGSFNNPAKLSPDALESWARLLKRTPNSRLLLKGRGFAEETTRQAFLTRFAAHGGDAARVILAGQLERLTDHLASYERIDIALDTFPYNGATTTCEAMWMGVPLVTILGSAHAGRVGASLLATVGLPELVAPSVEAYIDTAAALATDPGRLSSVRESLRERMAGSTLCDAPRFARKLETTYRELWRRLRAGASDAA